MDCSDAAQSEHLSSVHRLAFTFCAGVFDFLLAPKAYVCQKMAMTTAIWQHHTVCNTKPS